MFNDLFKTEHSYARRYKGALSIALMDIDHFKDINDTYGHNIGDMVLTEIAALVRSHIRESDIVARWGGEEFVILFPHTNPDEAYAVAEKLRILLEAYAFEEIGRLTCSFGVGSVAYDDTLANAVDRADASLYEAKRNGRNRVARSK